jgi:hypothetical protein
VLERCKYRIPRRQGPEHGLLEGRAMNMRTRPLALRLALLLAPVIGCSQAPGADAGLFGPPGDDASPPVLGAGDDGVDPQDAGGGGDDASWPSGPAPTDPPPDASSGPPDAAPPDACPSSLAPGDLVIDELMIESVAGTGDYGQWIEVTSTRACSLDLVGLHGECPKGNKVRTFDVTGDLWLAPGGFFVVADSSDPAVNHELPGLVLTWSGEPGDVLRLKGATVTLLVGGAILDSVTYPAMKLTVGASIAFPSDCPPASRLDFSSWRVSTASWFPGFFGTPNAPNDDVHCGG